MRTPWSISDNTPFPATVAASFGRPPQVAVAVQPDVAVDAGTQGHGVDPAPTVSDIGEEQAVERVDEQPQVVEVGTAGAAVVEGERREQRDIEAQRTQMRGEQAVELVAVAAAPPADHLVGDVVEA
jgi:hypothetical protein